MFTIDHLVLPTAALDVARSRLSLLGFTVAVEAHHPFGTGNACVFIADGIYLEPLSVVDAVLCEAAIADGNVFVREHRDFRLLNGGEGLSAVALATEDALADHHRFADTGGAEGEVLEFSRLATLPDGSEKLARFRLAFAKHVGTDSFSIFTCQRLEPFPADRTALERHANGVSAFVELVLVAQDAKACSERLEAVLETKVETVALGNHLLSATNAAVRVMAPENYEEEFGVADKGYGVSRSGLEGAAIVLRVPDLAVTRAVLAANDVAFVNKGGRIVVAPAPGQGVVFAFEE